MPGSLGEPSRAGLGNRSRFFDPGQGSRLVEAVQGPARTGRSHDMRVMLMIKGDPQPSAAPSEELLGAIGSYNGELQQAGVLIDLAGLLPSAVGRRVRFSGGNRAVVPERFPEAKQ